MCCLENDTFLPCTTQRHENVTLKNRKEVSLTEKLPLILVSMCLQLRSNNWDLDNIKKC